MSEERRGCGTGRHRIGRWVVAAAFASGAAIAPIGAATPTAHAAVGLPPGYALTLIARHPQFWSPYMMELAPDGRIFVLEQNNGKVRVVKNDVLLTTPFHTFAVQTGTDRGLISMVLAPNFPSTPYAYFMYSTTSGGNVVNRVSRLTANGDVAVAGSEVVVWESDPLANALYHYGGGMWIGADGKLYFTTGDRLTGVNAQSLTSRWGKIIRINLDGTIPADNPFYNQTTGVNRAIWAVGLRNPWESAQQPSTGDVFISDVGSATWEELDRATRGANYGWPTYEGAAGVAGFTDPAWQYNHATGTPTGCSITGGDFYEPPVAPLPAQFYGTFIVADHCEGWVKSVDLAHGNTVRDLFTGFERPVDVRVGRQGQIYVLVRTVDGSNGAGLYRIDYVGGSPLTITQQPQSQAASSGASVTFTVAVSGGTGPIRYQWQRNGTDIAGATGASYTRTNLTVADNGAQFRAVVSDNLATVNSQAATLAVTDNQPPVPLILTPDAGTTYGGGQVVNFSGSATDPEAGPLPAGAFTWEVVFHHNIHDHEFMLPVSGATSGSFTIPSTGEVDSDTFYRIHLTVRDPQGASTEVTRDLLPRLTQVTVRTSPANLLFTLDGTQRNDSITVTGVEGIQRTLGAVSPQSSGGTTYSFASWSDGGAATHTVPTPVPDTTYTVTYSPTTLPLALFVVGNSATPGNDAVVSARLQANGWAVTTIDDDIVSAASASGYDLVLISSSTSSTTVGAKFRDVAVPVIVWKPFVYDDMLMTGRAATDVGTATAVRTVVIGASSHPLAAGGPRTVTLTSVNATLPWGRPPGTADVVGTTAGLPSLFTFSPGDAMFGGVGAPACRVAFPGYATAFPKFTAAGWALFDQTVEWVRTGCAGA